MTFVRTPATPRKPFGSALSSLGPPFPPFGLPANQGSFHFYLGSSTFWEPTQQGVSGGRGGDVKAAPLRIWGGSVADTGIASLAVIDQRVRGTWVRVEGRAVLERERSYGDNV